VEQSVSSDWSLLLLLLTEKDILLLLQQWTLADINRLQNIRGVTSRRCEETIYERYGGGGGGDLESKNEIPQSTYRDRVEIWGVYLPYNLYVMVDNSKGGGRAPPPTLTSLR
jgi:hypothetical protein